MIYLMWDFGVDFCLDLLIYVNVIHCLLSKILHYIHLVVVFMVCHCI